MQFAWRGFPFTDNKLCVLAYELASRNNRRGFSPLKKCAGRSWLKGFLARYPQLKKKVSQNLSIARAIGANPTQVGNFFNHYRRWIHQWGLECQPNHIWNVDECGISDVPQTQKVIGLVGERPFQTVSGEKPVNTTLLTYVSAGGLHVPPMVIFKASRVKPEWREYAPSGYAVHASESGYISTKLFADYGEKFVQFLRESNLMTPGIKHVVLLDLHKSHLFNSSYMEYMQANNIEVCSFPPHCTHILQPLDDLPYAMLKRKFQKELISFNLQVAGEKLSKQQFFRVLIPAFSGAFQPEVIRKGFHNTGIYPLNQDAPKLKQLGPSQVYDKCKSNAVNCSFRHFRYWLPGWLPSWLPCCTNLFLFSSTCFKRVTKGFYVASGSHYLI